MRDDELRQLAQGWRKAHVASVVERIDQLARHLDRPWVHTRMLHAALCLRGTVRRSARQYLPDPLSLDALPASPGGVEQPLLVRAVTALLVEGQRTRHWWRSAVVQPVLAQPDLGELLRGVMWEGDQGQLFVFDEDGAPHDEHYERIAWPDAVTVPFASRLAHRMAAFQELLSDHERVAPFPQLGDPLEGVDELVRRVEKDARTEAVGLARTMDPEVVFRGLTACAHHTDPRVRDATLEVFKGARVAAAASLVAEGLDDSHPDVRARAAEACRFIGLDHLLPLLADLTLHDADGRVRSEAERSMRAWAGQRGARITRARLEHPDPTVRAAAARAAAGGSKKQLAGPLAQRVTDSNPQVRVEAVVAAAKVGVAVPLAAAKQVAAQSNDDRLPAALERLQWLATRGW